MRRMRVWPWLVHVTALLALAVVGNAQRREPFTGIVRDAAGRPVADAVVECVWQPDAFTGGVADRRSVITDADGRFATDLWVGHAYGMWVVGPTREDGTHLACAPTFAAVGGKRVDLVLDRTMTRLRPLVAGVTPWIKAGPLAVRVFVAAGCPLEHDITIPGDGIVNLPPLPVDEPTLCLVDGEGEIITAHVVTAGRVQLPEPKNLEFVVEDEGGKPLAGVEVLDLVYVPSHIPRTFGQASTSQLRVIATTDDGKASGLVPGRENDRLRMLHARLPGRYAKPSGWWLPDRIENGEAVGAHDDDVPIRFVMTDSERVSVHVLGLADGERAHGVFASHAHFRRRNGGGGIPVTVAATGGPARFTHSASTNGWIGARFTVWREADVPTRLLGWSSRFAGAGDLPDLDFTELRRIEVEVVDATGEPAAHTPCAITSSVSAVPMHCYCPIVTDADGRATLHIPPEKGAVFALRGHAGGSHELAKSSDDVRCRITLVDFTAIPVTVVEPDGTPVPFARFTSGWTVYDGRGLGVLASGRTADPLATARTDAAGRATLRVPPGFRAYSIAVHTLDGRRETAELHADGSAVTVRMPD